MIFVIIFEVSNFAEHVNAKIITNERAFALNFSKQF